MKFWLLTQLRNKVRKLAMLEDDFEEEENNNSSQPQQKYPEETMASKINHCSAFCVLADKEGAQCTSAPDVTWACAWCLVSRNITQK